jgi:hypothetical protein
MSSILPERMTTGHQVPKPVWGGAVRLLSSTKGFSSKLTTASITSKKKDNDLTPSTHQSSGSRKNSPPAIEENRTHLVGKDTRKDDPSPKDDSSSLRDVPRLIVVKEGQSNNTNEKLKQKQRIGLVKRRFPLEHEISDSGGKLIWVPAKAVVAAANHSMATTSQFPQIRATAWLDPAMYCRDGGKSIAGTDAARKLLRGKKDLMELLGYAVHSSKLNGKQKHQSYVLQGHGVPPQMLQHHIDFAAALLTRLGASEVSFKQFNVMQHHNSVAASEAVGDIRWTQVRDVETGENRAVSWPLEGGVHWEDDLQLYWTVMNRIATRLGLAVLLKRPRDTQSYDKDRPTSSTDNSLSVSPSNSLLKTPPHHWKVEFSRNWHFASEQLPPVNTRGSQLYPILEWAPLEGVASPGHVCIRLQGLASTDNDTVEAIPVSLCFDACFRSNTAMKYRN